MRTRDNLIKCFRHFSLRLAGRYNILITFEQYVELCKAKLTDAVLVQRDGRSAVFDGFMEIQGKNVRVIKDKTNGKMLITALPAKKIKNNVSTEGKSILEKQK